MNLFERLSSLFPEQCAKGCSHGEMEMPSHCFLRSVIRVSLFEWARRVLQYDQYICIVAVVMWIYSLITCARFET